VGVRHDGDVDVRRLQPTGGQLTDEEAATADMARVYEGQLFASHERDGAHPEGTGIGVDAVSVN
jgi:hypothetical protein